ncbi:MAG: shikimate dehydrogenase [Pseudomonadota bacterium]
MTDHYAVFGNPIAHSKSPLIHRAFAEQTAQDMGYEAILAAREGFTEALEQFKAAGGRGANVTLPFKEEAYRYATQRTTRAEQAGAVNTLRFDGLETLGDNTDGVGLVQDLQVNLNFALGGQSILLLGAGGAARGVIGPLLAACPARLFIANRTAHKAHALATRFKTLYAPLSPLFPLSPSTRIDSGSFAETQGQTFDLILNATSASLENTCPSLPSRVFAAGSLAYDMMYGQGETAFLAMAKAQGAARLADGLGMLVEQAAEAFFVWRGVRPSSSALLHRLRTQ